MSDTYPFTISDETPGITHTFYPKPGQSGEGKVELKISVQTGVSDFGRVTASCSKSAWAEHVSEPSYDGSSGKWIIQTKPSNTLPSGTYEVAFNFYNTSNILLYSTVQTINVFDNMTTNTWVSDGSGAINDSGEFSLSADLVSQFARTTFYVGQTAAATKLKITASDITGNGSPYAPLATIRKVASIIAATGDSSNDYRIFVSGTLERAQEIPDTLTTGSANSITIQGYNGLDSSGSPKDAIHLTSQGAALYVTSGVPVTLRNLKILGSQNPSVETIGLGLEANKNVDVTISDGVLITGHQTAGVYISEGAKFSMTGGKISGNHAANGGGVTNGGTFVMTGGEISGNTSTEKGGAVANSGAFNIGGSAHIPYGGAEKSNDIYLASGKTVTLSSPLTAHSASDQIAITPAEWTRGKTVVQADDTNVKDLTPYKNFFTYTQDGWGSKVSTDKKSIYIDTPIYVAGTEPDREVCTADGSDVTGEGTKAKPFATIAKAIELLTDKNTDYTIYIDGRVIGVQTIPDTLKRDGTGDYNARSLTLEGVNGLDSSTQEPKDILDGNKSGATLTVDSNVPVTITNLKIINGTGKPRYNKDGGGIFISDGASLALGDGALVTQNTAQYGGGIYNLGKLFLYGTAMVGMQTNSVATSDNWGNKATEGGAGIYVSTEGQIYLGYRNENEKEMLTGGVCGNYNAGIIDEYDRDFPGGGGIHLSGSTDTAKIEIASGNISYNYAVNGAGIYATGNVTMTGGTIKGNEGNSDDTENGKGGGLYLSTYSIGSGSDRTFTMSGSAVIENNKNIAFGAGVYLRNSNSIFKMNGGEISGNIALSNGGAVYQNDGPSFNIQGEANIPYGGEANNNDIYMRYSSIKITAPLSPDRDAGNVIGLTQSYYFEGKTLLKAEDDSDVTLADEVGKFTVTPEEDHPEKTWRVNYQGILTDGYDAAEITLENYESVTKMSVTSADGMKVISSLSDSTNKKTFEGKTITLKEDISLGSDFTPIGSGSSGFKGTFDGNNKTITISDAVVFDKLAQKSLVKNLNLAGNTTKGYALASGDVSGTVEYCTSTVRITNCASAGGFVYRVTTNGKVQYCINKGTIDLTAKASGNAAGGIAYSVYGGTVDRCINEANISGKNIYLGGIAGTITWHGTISNCKNTGNVTTSQSLSGGIVALMNSDGAGIKNCSSSGTITSSSTSSTQILYIVGKVSTGLCPVENTCDRTYYHSSNSNKTGYSSNIDATLETLNSWASANNGVSWKKNGSILELDLSL